MSLTRCHVAITFRLRIEGNISSHIRYILDKILSGTREEVTCTDHLMRTISLQLGNNDIPHINAKTGAERRNIHKPPNIKHRDKFVMIRKMCDWRTNVYDKDQARNIVKDELHSHRVCKRFLMNRARTTRNVNDSS